MASVGEEDIPEALSNRLSEEKKLEMIKRKEKSEAYLYMTVRIVLEDLFYGHQVKSVKKSWSLLYNKCIHCKVCMNTDV